MDGGPITQCAKGQYSKSTKTCPITPNNFNSEELRKEFDGIDSLTEKRLGELLDLFLEDFKANLVEAHGWPTGGSSAYKVAKAALNAYTRILAKKYCLTPGYAKTDISMHMGVLTPKEGASNSVKVALLPDDGPTGAYFDRDDLPVLCHTRASHHFVRAEFVQHAHDGSHLNFPKHEDRCGHRGNKGIGLEVCRQLAGNGVTVVLTARDEKRGTEAVEKLKGSGISDVLFHQLDITDASSITGLADFLKTRFGRVDILVNDAAYGGVEFLRGSVYNSVSTEEEVQ
ncbi:hypothetical protein PR202_gb14882 [Eleusine coracana subsp. coracana]|uniref:Uncharacterized protein n=1 Tax=Eleusine coracana subsp. coracana TaxID=191504 RepID=A0AAV5EW64_ELECO|nr:hypothetical protein PR202_gb14882 [Eleusine coracana subsp. coracana]